VFDAAAHAEFLESGHHLADGKAGNLSRAAEGGFALLVLFDGEQDAAFPIAGTSRFVRGVLHPDSG